MDGMLPVTKLHSGSKGSCLESIARRYALLEDRGNAGCSSCSGNLGEYEKP